MSKEQTLYTHLTDHSFQTNHTIQTKFATLSPYLVEIQVPIIQHQKRKRVRSVLKDRGNGGKNELSSKSFRIKQRSSTSLHSKDLRQGAKNKAIINIIENINANKKQDNTKKKLANRSNQKFNQLHKSPLIKNDKNHNRVNSRNCQAQEKKKKGKKQISFRKNMYERSNINSQTFTLQIKSDKKIQKNQVPKQKKIDSQFPKYGYTDTHHPTHKKKQKSQDFTMKNTQEIVEPKNNRKKFRKNKYEQLYSSVTSTIKQPSQQYQHETDTYVNNSKRGYEGNYKSQEFISKKQSNSSINKQMDHEAEMEIRKFYRQMRSKQIKRSLQKSTEKYFKEGLNYRMPKTNNDIQICVSTMKNPSYNRTSDATTNTSNNNNNKPQKAAQITKQKQTDKLKNVYNCMQYDFDFQNQSFVKLNQKTVYGGECQGITQMQNSLQEESIQFQEASSFERQRKEVQKQYFFKQSPKIQWSDEDCQIDSD